MTIKGKGAVKDIPDSRDYQWSRIAGASIFDWEKGFDVEKELGIKLKAKDQDGSYSCGGQAWAYYGAVLETATTKTYEEHSAKFIYAHTNVQPGGGSNGRDNCEFCVNNGWALESDCPSYDKGKPPAEPFVLRKEDITLEARNKASYSKALVYANVQADIDILANAVKNNYGCVIGIEGEDNGTWYSLYPKPPVKTKWAHWVYVYGAVMIKGKKYLMIKNSWGDTVGANGTQYIGEDYFKAGKVWNGWTLVFDKPNLVAKLKGERLSLMQQLLNKLKEELSKALGK